MVIGAKPTTDSVPKTSRSMLANSIRVSKVVMYLNAIGQHMNCPYDELTLKIALMSGASKLEKYLNEHGDQAVTAAIDKVIPSQTMSLTEATAKHHGVDVNTLVNSPNYATMKAEYQAHSISQLIGVFESVIGLENKEAWAVVLSQQLT